MKSTGFAEIPQPIISITPHLMTNIKGLEDAQPLSKTCYFPNLYLMCFQPVCFGVHIDRYSD